MQKFPMVSGEHLPGKSNAIGLLLPGRGNSIKYVNMQQNGIHLRNDNSFQIRNAESQNCLDTMGHKSGERVGSSYCHSLGGNQVFAYTKRHQVMSDDNCLDAANSRGPVNLVRCHGMMGNQEWKYDAEVSSRFSRCI